MISKSVPCQQLCHKLHIAVGVPSCFLGKHVSSKHVRLPCAGVVHNRRQAKATKTYSLIVFRSDDVVLETFVGTAGIMNVSSYTPGGSYGQDLQLQDVQQLGQQTLEEGEVKVRIYTGRVATGALAGTRVILKAYPSSRVSQADVMAANELSTHANLQSVSIPAARSYLVELLGGFVTTKGANAGEQWLVFTNDGIISVGDYAEAAAQATQAGVAVGEGEFWDRFDKSRVVQRRQTFILSIMRQILCGLAFMHANFMLHQSLGPYSVVINRVDERDVSSLRVRLRDLAFAVDVSDSALYGGPTLGELWDGAKPKENPARALADSLWQRARSAGAWSEIERRNFGYSDDVYAAGLLLAYLAFMPLCQPGSIDAPALQRLLESTFRLDVFGARDYAEADDRWLQAVDFLDTGNKAGWDLLQAMLNPDWRRRPTAEACLQHPFLSGAAFSASPPIPPGQQQQGAE